MATWSLHTMASGRKRLSCKITTFLHPVTSSASVVLEVEREEPELDLPPVTAKKSKHLDSGFTNTWLDEFPWLRYFSDDQESPFMYCALCRNTVSHPRRWCGYHKYTLLEVSRG